MRDKEQILTDIFVNQRIFDNAVRIGCREEELHLLKDMITELYQELVSQGIDIDESSVEVVQGWLGCNSTPLNPHI